MTQTPDIFISIRKSTEPLAEAIGKELDKLCYVTAWMGKETGGPAGERYVNGGVDYEKEYEQLIDAAPLTLVLICSDTGLDPADGNSRCIQKDEIAYSVKRDLHRSRSQSPTHTLLVFAPGDFANSQEAANAHLNRHLTSIKNPEKLQQFRFSADPSEDKSELERLAGHIHDQYGQRLALGLTKQERAKRERAADRNRAAGPPVTDGEAESGPSPRHFEAWLTGRLAGGDNEAPDHGRQETEAFAYDPATFMSLAAEATASNNPTSVFDAIFERSPTPLLIKAPTGAGKTTTLATAAALAASQHRPEFETAFRNASQTHAKLLDQCGPLVRKRRFLPVTVSAAVLADKLRARNSYNEDHNASTVLREIEYLSKYNKWAFEQQMGGRPILLLLDGLDEAGEQHKQILKDLTANHTDDGDDDAEDSNNAPLRVVMTTRSSLPIENKENSLVVLNLQGPREDDIERFIGAYLSEHYSDGQAGRELVRKRLLKDAESMKARADTSEILRSPLLLNAYCWVRAREEQDGLAYSRAEFCRRLVDRMLQDAGIKVAGSDFPADSLVKLLRALAYGMILAGGTLTKNSAADILLDAASNDARAREAFSEGGPTITASDLLRQLRVQVGFVRSARVAGEVEIAPRLLADYLAAEHVYGDRGGSTASKIEKLLPKPNPERIADLEPLLGFWMSLPLNTIDALRGQEALEIPRALLERANQERGADNLSEAMAWFAAACRVRDYCVGTRFPVDEETKSHARELEQAAIDFYISVAPMLDESRKVKAIDALATMWLTDKPERTRERIHQLLDELTDRRPEWIDIGVESDCGGRLEVAARPVLVCDYEEYLVAPADKALVGWLDELARNVHSMQGKHVRRTFRRRRPPIEKWAMMSKRLAAPVSYLTWVEAVHYALWRDKKEGENICVRLPTESEWRRISQVCADNKRFPWRSDQPPGGGASPAPHRGLTLEGPVPPGVFPAPEGMPFDFGTNVAMWLIHGDGEAPDWPPPDTEPESVKHIGGRWNKALQELRASTSKTPSTPAALHPKPDDRFIGVGLRLVRIVRKNKESVDGA